MKAIVDCNSFYCSCERLFRPNRQEKPVYNINFSMRDDVLKFATSGLSRNWKMRQELRSKRYTTRWE